MRLGVMAKLRETVSDRRDWSDDETVYGIEPWGGEAGALLPNKSRGVRRVDDWPVLNGIFWVTCSGAPWHDLPERYGPPTTCHNRFFLRFTPTAMAGEE